MHVTRTALRDDEPGLSQLVQILLDADAALPPDVSTVLVKIGAVSPGVEFPTELDLGIKPLGADDFDGHPGDLLLGFVAPPDWWAIGVIASGRTHRLAEGSATRPEPNTARAARLAHLVARNGHSATAYRHVDRTEVEVLHTTDAVPGYLADVCRRTLGLATAPPEHGAARHWEDPWLDRVLRVAIRGARTVTWEAAVAMHPLAHELPLRVGPEALRDLVADRAAQGWAGVLASAARGDRIVLADGTCCLPGLAAWFDEGSFSRALIGVTPDRVAMLDALAELVRSSVFEAIETALTPEA